MDFDGDLYGEQSLLRGALKEHEFNEKTWECTMVASKQVLNISELLRGDHSRVPRLEDKLVFQGHDNERSIQLIYLKNTRVRTLRSKTEANGRIDIACKESPSLNCRSLTWTCIDSSIEEYQEPVLFGY